MRFKSKLLRYPGPGGWTFARIPQEHAPPVTDGWGRTPVLAVVDGRAWETSVWRDTTHGTLLAVPKRVRGAKGDGDLVDVELLPAGPRPRRRRRRAVEADGRKGIGTSAGRTPAKRKGAR